MNIEWLKNSKCPDCQKYGICAFRKTRFRQTFVLECKHCKQKYKVNTLLSVLVKLSIVFGVGIAGNVINKSLVLLPSLFYYVIALGLLALFEYFAPLEPYDK